MRKLWNRKKVDIVAIVAIIILWTAIVQLSKVIEEVKLQEVSAQINNR